MVTFEQIRSALSDLTTAPVYQPLFEKFWGLGNYDAQNYNLLQNIELLPKKSQKIQSVKEKTTPHPKQYKRQ